MCVMTLSSAHEKLHICLPCQFCTLGEARSNVDIGLHWKPNISKLIIRYYAAAEMQTLTHGPGPMWNNAGTDDIAFLLNKIYVLSLMH